MKLPMPAPDLKTIVESFSTLEPSDLIGLLTSDVDDSEYLHWDKLRYKTPPEGLSHEQWWFQLKSKRRQQRRIVPLFDKEGEHFSYSLNDQLLATCEKITRSASGEIKLPEPVATGRERNQYIINSLIEEAITSSQLEGASTSRRVAKDMLQSGRKPATNSERMIFNNFSAMMHIRQNHDQKLTPELVFELHRIVTDGTLEDPDDAGRLEQPGVPRVGVWGDEEQLLHAPPPAEELPRRLQALCDFANRDAGDGSYMPPVVRAIVLHFMMGYDHYFADGNGRTARALFYWSMLHQGYWLAEFITISRILRKAPGQYARSYLLTEDDDGDLTYFLLYHVQVVSRALDDLTVYLGRKTREMSNVRSLLHLARGEFNHRQISFLELIAKDPSTVANIRWYAGAYASSGETARHDLAALEKRGLLMRSKSGKQYVWRATHDLVEKLQGGS